MIVSSTDNPQEIHRRVSMSPQQRDRVTAEAMADMAARLEGVLRHELAIAGSRHVGGYRNFLLTRRAYLPTGDLHSHVQTAYRLALLAFARRYWFAVHGVELPQEARQQVGELAGQAARRHVARSLADLPEVSARDAWIGHRLPETVRDEISTLARWVEAQATTTTPLAD